MQYSTTVTNATKIQHSVITNYRSVLQDPIVTIKCVKKQDIFLYSDLLGNTRPHPTILSVNCPITGDKQCVDEITVFTGICKKPDSK